MTLTQLKIDIESLTTALLYNYPGLTLQDLQAVANYYDRNREEIDLWLAENE